MSDLRRDERGDTSHERENQDNGGDADRDTEAGEEAAPAITLDRGTSKLVMSSKKESHYFFVFFFRLDFFLFLGRRRFFFSTGTGRSESATVLISVSIEPSSM